MMKQWIAALVSAALLGSCLMGCGAAPSSGTAEAAGTAGAVSNAEDTPEAGTPDKDITVISREEGSGTRGAFVELMGIEDDDGDHTVDTAEISNSTSVVTQTVAGNPAAIGYISLGSLNDTVKAISVDGVAPTVENIKAGLYAVSRPFEVCYQEPNLTDLGRDFLSFLMSREGQAIVSEEGYIPMDEAAEGYTGSGMSGTLSLGGSTSVSPLMEKLAEAYRAIHPDVTIDIQQTGSGAGITAAIDGSCEIGMSSRALKDEELSQGLTERQLALDGIAVIVNRDNGVSDLSAEQIRKIFVGEVTNWSQLG